MSSNESLVNWKLFELQAALLEDDVDPRYLDVSRDWFTKVHFQVVIEERNTERKCGYPLCKNICPGPIPSLLHMGKVVHDCEEDSFCSSRCMHFSRVFQESLLDSNPCTREVARSLRPTSKQNSHAEIDELLEVLVGHKESKEKLIPIKAMHLQDRPVEENTLSSGGPDSVEFGPADDAIVDVQPVSRRPPAARPPTDKALPPSARDTQRRTQSVKNKAAADVETGPETVISLDDSSFKSSTLHPELKSTEPAIHDRETSGPKGFMWIDNEDVQTRKIIELANDTKLEEMEDSSEIPDPRKIEEITSWTSSWDTITTIQTSSNLKRPIRRGVIRPSQARSVQWADNKLEQNRETQNQVQTKKNDADSRNSEKQIPTNNMVKNHSFKTKPRTINSTVVERESVMPAPLSRNGLAGSNPAASAAAAATSDGNSPTGGGIEGYMPMIESIRVAPATILRDMTFDPLASQNGEDSKEKDEKILKELFGSSNTPCAEEDMEHIGQYSDTWFVSLWSALEDLFDYDCIMNFNDHHGAIAPFDAKVDNDNAPWGGDEDEEVAQDQPYMAGNTLVGIQAVKQILVGGIKCAENVIFIKRKLSTKEMIKYIDCKNRLIKGASLERSHHFSLCSTQWNILGAIIVSSILEKNELSLDIADSMFSRKGSWRQHIESVVNSFMSDCAVDKKEGGVRKFPLDKSELDILLNFFQVEK